MTRRLLAVLTICLMSICPVMAQTPAKPLVHPLFSNDMVLQRDKPIRIWGWARPGAEVVVQVERTPPKRTVANQSGQWRMKIGPFAASNIGATLKIDTEGQSQSFSNVVVGDVWICSGQSNMEWPVSNSKNAALEKEAAQFPAIRLFTVPRRIASEPQELVNGSWASCTPKTVGGFSAVAYFFGRALHRKLDVPIGLIHSSWGGTVAEAWTSSGALQKNMPEFLPALKVASAVNSGEAQERYEAQVEQWWRKHTKLPWTEVEFDDRDWHTMTLPANWEVVDAELADFDGLVWFRKTVELSADQISDGTLMLPAIDDSDSTYINGHFLGKTDGWNQPRKYPVKASMLNVGTNVISVGVYDNSGGGGIHGQQRGFALDLVNTQVALQGEWRYHVAMEKGQLSVFPQSSFENPNVVTVLHNGMLRPLQPFGIRGAIWYQGESNAGRPMQYRRLLPTLINDWRAGFQQGEFPFLIVQLANFMERQQKPIESGWAELREAQEIAAKGLHNVGLAVTTDIGDAADIHPKNKQDVGKRLALQALKIAYQEDVLASGPTMVGMNVVGNELHLDFDNVGSGLLVRGETLRGFAIAELGGDFHWADARIEEERVVLSHADLAEPLLIRYNWANNPVGNLFNQAGLPAPPFRTDVPPTTKP